MFGKILKYEVDGSRINIEFENGKGFVEVISDYIIRVFSNFDSICRESKAVSLERRNDAYFNVEKNDESISIKTGALNIFVFDGFKTDIFDTDGNAICCDYRGERKAVQGISDEDKKIVESEGHTVNDESGSFNIQVLKSMDNVKAFYGLGDKTGFLNKAGYQYEMWNTDNPDPQVDCFKALYKSIPFFAALTDGKPYGIFFDNTYHSYFDMGKECSEYYYFAANEGDLDYYFITGNTLADIIKGYTYLTGRMPLPQLFTLGYHQSRWSYASAEEVREIADNMRKYKIPCDTIHLDIDYMDEFKVFTFSDERFPKAKEFIKDLSSEGFKVVTIIDPGVKVEDGYQIYDEGKEKGYFAKNGDGSIYENRVWPGTSVFPDFGREDVRNWWADNQKFLVDMGVRGIWNDMNEPASFNGPLPDDVQFEYGAHEKVHNIYGHFMAKATYEGLAKNDGGKRPFVLTRAAYAGSQKYCGGWTGDNHSIWAHIALSLEQVCNLSVSGLAMCGSDIGGFGSDTTPELLVRFYEAAVFVPFFRNHSAMGTRRQEPWQFDETTIDAVRKTVKLRYRFIPYIYDLAHECEKTGAPIVRPLVYEYPADKHVRNISDEYMLGSFVLVAPVIAPGKEAREVYLPDGDWYDYYTGEKYSGGRYILANAPLDKVPVFIKAGAIIPVADGEIRSTEDITEDKISILTYPGKGSFVHYQDDNETFAYRNGAYNAVEYTLDGETLEKRVLHKGL